MQRSTNGFRKFLQRHTCCLFRVGSRNRSPDQNIVEEASVGASKTLGRSSTFNDDDESIESEREVESSWHRQGNEKVHMPSSDPQNHRSTERPWARTLLLSKPERVFAQREREHVPVRESEAMRVSEPMREHEGVRVEEEGYVPVDPMVVSSDPCRPPPSPPPPSSNSGRQTGPSLTSQYRSRPTFFLRRLSGIYVPLIAVDASPHCVVFIEETTRKSARQHSQACGNNDGTAPAGDEISSERPCDIGSRVSTTSNGESEERASTPVSGFPSGGREMDVLLEEFSPGTSFASSERENDGSQSGHSHSGGQTGVQSPAQWAIPRSNAVGSMSCPQKLASLSPSPESPDSVQSQLDNWTKPHHRCLTL